MTDADKLQFVKTAIGFLNDLLKIDPIVVKNILLKRRKCGSTLSQHPDVFSVEENGSEKISALSLINAVLSDSNYPLIAAKVRTDLEFSADEYLDEFCLYSDPNATR